MVSVEVDPVHVCIARSVLEYAGVADRVDMYCGHSEDAIPHLGPTCGGLPADVALRPVSGGG